MPNHYNVLSPRKYIKDGQEKTAFTKVGIAFPMKDKDGFSLMLEALPLSSMNDQGKLECRLLLLPPIENEEQSAKPQKSTNDAVKGDSIPF